MKAKVGDRIVVWGRSVTTPDRECEVLEARGADGGPPFLVRWLESGHEALFFPGSDASVVPAKPEEGVKADRSTEPAGLAHPAA
jgi:hypothetical protein